MRAEPPPKPVRFTDAKLTLALVGFGERLLTSNMDPRLSKIVYFHVSDSCNMRCVNCHWFSGDVAPRTPAFRAEEVHAFLERTGPYDRAVFSGGEPTLWPDLAVAVNGVPPCTRQVAVYTNGSRPAVLAAISRTNVYLRLSIHAETAWEALRETLSIARSRGWLVKAYGYETDFAQAVVPHWFDLPVTVKQDQVERGRRDFTHLIGRTVRCRPRMVFFATDGNAYTCEKGIRHRRARLREDFSLWHGLPHLRQRECQADAECPSCWLTEQFIEVDGAVVDELIREPHLNPFSRVSGCE